MPSINYTPPSDEPGPIIDGWCVVSWGNKPWLMVGVAAVFLGCMLALWWFGLRTHDPDLVTATMILLIPIAASLAGAWFYARQRFLYRDDTLILTPLWGKPREYRISELRSIGLEYVRGTEIIPPHGENFYINKYQQGGLVLIELITGRKDPNHPDDSEWLREWP